MLPAKILITGIFITAVMFGCAKKKTQENGDAFQQIPSLSDSKASDTTDIFDEFYKDDFEQDAGQPAKSTNRQTRQEERESFSTSTNVSSSSDYEFTKNGRYVVQISTVRSRTYAEELATRFNEKGYTSYVAEVNNPTPQLSGTYYRVRLGGFRNVTSARNFAQSVLVPAGYEFWVDNRSNDNIGIEGYGLGVGSDYSAPFSSSATSPSVTAPVHAKTPAVAKPVSTNIPKTAVTPKTADSPVKSESTPAPAAQSAAPAITNTPAPEAAAPAKTDTSKSGQWDSEWDSEW